MAYEAGASLATIAAERKSNKQSVRRVLVEAGVEIRQQGLSEEQASEVVQRYLEGYSGREVAAEFGVGTATVWRTLKEAGVPVATPHSSEEGRPVNRTCLCSAGRSL